MRHVAGRRTCQTRWVDTSPDVVVVVGTALGALAAGTASLLATRSFGRAVNRERAELREELLPDDSGTAGDGVPAEKGSEKFTRLLIRYYGYGLTQARASFYVSLVASILGGLVLIIGVCLAVFHADTDGDQYSSIVASVAGLLTVAIGTLFHRRADVALRHMESQTTALRQDMKRERDIGQAVELLDTMAGAEPLEAQLRAALILKFTGSEMPVLPGQAAPARSEESSQT